MFLKLSDWFLFNSNSAIFSAVLWWEQLIFNEMMMKSALHYINILSWIFIVLAHLNKIWRVDM